MPPPRPTPLPSAQSYFCSLCQKGYHRTTDYEAHLLSYDHSHKQRLKEMKLMVRDPQAAARARRAEDKLNNGAVMAIKSNATADKEPAASGSGFKKGGFKKTGFVEMGNSGFATVARAAATSCMQDKDDEVIKDDATSPLPPSPALHQSEIAKGTLEESDTDGDKGYQLYDPHYPTD